MSKKIFFCDMVGCGYYSSYEHPHNCSRTNVNDCPYKQLWDEHQDLINLTNRKVIEINLSGKSYSEQQKIIDNVRKLYCK